MKAIGGYFELELDKKGLYHPEAVALNTGRNALEYILRARACTKIYIPYFTCDVLLQPLQRLGVSHEFYRIDEQLEPVFDYSRIETGAAFLYTNYFGLKDDFISRLAAVCPRLIIDNAQSFFSPRQAHTDTFYSPRKFFGLPDGAYAYCDGHQAADLPKDVSFERMAHLLKRIDLGAEQGYQSFTENDRSLDHLPVRRMSDLTTRLLESVDYEKVRHTRIRNYSYLDRHLKAHNRLRLPLTPGAVPMVYPFWGTPELREKLIRHRIYTAKYWPNVYIWTAGEGLEATLTDALIHLPVDQRQSETELNTILEIIAP